MPTDRDSSRANPAIVLRPARPTVAEGLAYARYLDEVSEGFFRFRLGERAVDIISAAYVERDHDLSYQNVTFAETGQRIVGMASGFTAVQQRRFSDRPLKRAAGGQAWRLRLTGIIAAPLLRIIETIPDDDFYLVTMIVDGNLRGTGVGSMLLDHIEERARALGSARIALDVAAKNRGARRLYERRGWSVESHWPGLPLLPTVFLRMTKRV
jgi:GNAT superfamily N-acetyltransferase